MNSSVVVEKELVKPIEAFVFDEDPIPMCYVIFLSNSNDFGKKKIDWYDCLFYMPFYKDAIIEHLFEKIACETNIKRVNNYPFNITRINGLFIEALPNKKIFLPNIRKGNVIELSSLIEAGKTKNPLKIIVCWC
jgi:hypothetical protein